MQADENVGLFEGALAWNFQDKEIFVFNNSEGRFGLRDIASISGLGVSSPAQDPSFQDRFFAEIKQISYEEIN